MRFILRLGKVFAFALRLAQAPERQQTFFSDDLIMEIICKFYADINSSEKNFLFWRNKYRLDFEGN